ncbi:Mitotic checkpoint protein BUB3.3 [Linum grandiflorum]
MSGYCLMFENPIGDSVSRIRFAPSSNNLLISSWDSSLRLYDVDSSTVRLEASVGFALLDCCFGSEDVSYSAASDGCIRRCDFNSGSFTAIGRHDDVATCLVYSDETCQVISSGWDKKMVSWDIRSPNSVFCSRNMDAEVEAMSLSGYSLTVALGGSINTYDLRYMEQPASQANSFDARVRSVCSVPYCKGYAAGSVDGIVALEISNSTTSEGTRYAFRCHPKSSDGKKHLIAVNDVQFNPVIFGAFVTGDNEGNVIAWDAQSKRRLHEFPRYPTSIASLSYNHDGELLAVASSHTYQQAAETNVRAPQIFVCKMGEISRQSSFSGGDFSAT